MHRLDIVLGWTWFTFGGFLLHKRRRRLFSHLSTLSIWYLSQKKLQEAVFSLPDPFRLTLGDVEVLFPLAGR